MSEFFAASNQPMESTNPKVSWIVYFLIGLIANIGLWSLAFIYLKGAEPVYSSKWALTLPSASSSTNINLPDIGATTSFERSPYDNLRQDPRENYKFIAESAPVVKEAAERLDMSAGEFGKPRVKIVENTTLITFELSADNPEEAQNKSWALWQSFQERLNELRLQEEAQEDANTQATLVDAQRKLESAQKRLSEYKARTGLAANTQIDQLSSNIEELRRRKAEVLAQQQETTARINELSGNLDLTAPQAADAFALKADKLFQQHRRDYSDATASLEVLESRYGPNHPAVVRERGEQQAAQAAFRARSQVILGQPVGEAVLTQLNLGDSSETGSAREALFQELVTVQAAQQGYQASARELNLQIAELEDRLRTLAQYGSGLDGLRRDMQIAEAVFSSTLASLDLSKSKVSGNYPKVQLLTEPSLPGRPISPKPKFVFLGAAVGSLFLTSGLVLLGLRQQWLSKPKTSGSERIELAPEPKGLRPDSKPQVLGMSNIDSPYSS